MVNPWKSICNCCQNSKIVKDFRLINAILSKNKQKSNGSVFRLHVIIINLHVKYSK